MTMTDETFARELAAKLIAFLETGTAPEGLFTADLFRFLEDLRTHNDRAWFTNNKERYLDAVQEPALEFVRVRRL